MTAAQPQKIGQKPFTVRERFVYAFLFEIFGIGISTPVVCLVDWQQYARYGHDCHGDCGDGAVVEYAV